MEDMGGGRIEIRPAPYITGAYGRKGSRRTSSNRIELLSDARREPSEAPMLLECLVRSPLADKRENDEVECRQPPSVYLKSGQLLAMFLTGTLRMRYCRSFGRDLC